MLDSLNTYVVSMKAKHLLRVLVATGSPILAALALLFGVVTWASADDWTAILEVPAQPVQQGTPFTVTVAVSGVTSIGAYEHRTGWHPGLTLHDIADTGELGSTGRDVHTLGPTYPTTWTAHFGAFTGGSAPGPSGDLALTWLAFDGAPQGVYTVALSSLKWCTVSATLCPSTHVQITEVITVYGEPTKVGMSRFSASPSKSTGWQRIVALLRVCALHIKQLLLGR